MGAERKSQTGDAWGQGHSNGLASRFITRLRLTGEFSVLLYGRCRTFICGASKRVTHCRIDAHLVHGAACPRIFSDHHGSPTTEVCFGNSRGMSEQTLPDAPWTPRKDACRPGSDRLRTPAVTRRSGKNVEKRLSSFPVFWAQTPAI